jgi:hypothetical protein
MWPVNQRVLARGEGADEWLPGTVRHVDGQRHYVILDSGDDGWFAGDQLRPIEPGSGAAAKPRDWQVGDRVFARWGGDLLWYPGTVYARRDAGYQIVFDDQDQALVGPGDILPLVVEEGDRVLCRPKFERELRYFPAEVTRVDGETIDVTYDDLEMVETNTNVSRIRIRRSASGGTAWDEGDRALVSGRDGFCYPAVILVVDGDRLFVSLLDSRHAWVLPDEVRPLRVRAGSAVQVRHGAGAEYQSAEVVQADGEVLRVRYADGEEETTLLRLLRVPLEAEGETEK